MFGCSDSDSRGRDLSIYGYNDYGDNCFRHNIQIIDDNNTFVSVMPITWHKQNHNSVRVTYMTRKR